MLLIIIILIMIALIVVGTILSFNGYFNELVQSKVENYCSKYFTCYNTRKENYYER